jgi:hypothetical protein
MLFVRARRGVLRYVAGVLVLLGIPACHAPEGKSHGRVAPGTVTKAEERATGPQIRDMQEASDDVAQALIADLNRVLAEEVTDPSVRILVVFGDIQNKSRVPTSDFEMIRERIKDKLQKSRDWRNNVKYVVSRKRVEELNRQELGTDRNDLLDEGAAGHDVKRPAAEHMYYLNGNTYGIYRGTTEFYYLSFNLTRASDAAEIFSQEYEAGYDKKKH